MKYQNKRRTLCLFVTAFLLFITSVLANFQTLQVKAAATTPVSGNIYYLKNKNSGLYLSVENDSTQDGANIIQASGTGSLGQRWILEQNWDGSYRIHPATDMTGNHSIDIENGNGSNGTNVRVWPNNGASAQNFGLQDTGDGYVITTAASSYSACLDVSGAKKYSGANVLQWQTKYSANQIWYFEQAPWPDNGNGNSQSNNGSDPNSGNNDNQTGNNNTNNGNQNENNQNNNGGNNTNSNGTTISIDPNYCMQKLQLQSENNNTFLTENNGNLTASSQSSLNNQWVLVNNGANQYQIANAQTGTVLTPENNNAYSGARVITTKNVGNSSQYWIIQAASYDTNGDALTYRISNCANQNLCLQLSGSNYVLGNFQNSSTHRFYLNTYGVEGFAGKCKSVNGRTKTSITGGVLGKVVTVSDFNSLSQYCAGDTPYTIILSNNIYQGNLSKINVGKNKTIIGSYNASILSNVHFRCGSNSGNIIFKNLNLQHDSNKNANDDIQIYVTGGNNYWVDHCTFPGHSYLMDSDVDKLLYIGQKADYVTVSNSIFMNHKYGLILGYPNDDGVGTYSGYPQMTLCNNYYYGVITRAPGLMRYGYFHSYNNFVYNFDLGYTPYTGCNIYSENNYFDAGSHKGAVVNDMKIGNFTDSGSVLSSNISRISLAKTSFRPASCYSYNAKDAYSAKSWCQNYAGVKSGKLVYPRD